MLKKAVLSLLFAGLIALPVYYALSLIALFNIGMDLNLASELEPMDQEIKLIVHESPASPPSEIGRVGQAIETLLKPDEAVPAEPPDDWLNAAFPGEPDTAEIPKEPERNESPEALPETHSGEEPE